MPATALMPFGLSRALPVDPATSRSWPGTLAYSPEKQLTVVEETGQPFINTSSMGTSIQTTTQTQEDSQIFTDNGGTDTD